MARYVGIFHLPKPTHEHAKIDNVIRDATGGEFKKVLLGGNTLLYIFDSPTYPHKLAFGGALLNGDGVIFFEVGDYFTSVNFGALEGWINSHRGR